MSQLFSRHILTRGVMALSALAAFCGCDTYHPLPLASVPFLKRAQTQSDDQVRVTVAVLSAEESRAAFGVPTYDTAVQPVWLKIENLSRVSYLLADASVDPNKFSPLEAAYRSHYRFSPSLNEEIDRHFLENDIRRLVPPGATVSGFLYTNLDLGAKEVQVVLIGPGQMKRFTFFFRVPGLRTHYDEVNFNSLYKSNALASYDKEGFRQALEKLPCCTTNASGSADGDPLNLVLVGEIEDLLTAFLDRQWDMTEKVYSGSAWREVKAFLFGAPYRYAPFSPLYLYGRRQDLSIQKPRQTITARNHLRLWRAPMAFEGKPVWLGQVSRDIGVRFTLRTWNLATHRIDPQLDEAREYLVQDLVFSERVATFGYVRGGPPATLASPRKNLTGDPYVTDGLRAVLVFSHEITPILSIQTLDWEWPESFNLKGSVLWKGAGME